MTSSPAHVRALAQELTDLLNLKVPPLAITFAAAAPADIPRYEGNAPAPTADGRTGAVPAGCVFWLQGTRRAFHTLPADHGNCSVGSYTHGFKTLAEAATGADVAALLESGWVTMEVVPQIPQLSSRPQAIVYGPLAEADQAPDVVLLHLNGMQTMVLRDAWPELRFEGKPQCHIIPIAKEQGQVCVSVGCMLSRVRTEMPNSEVTCTIPGIRLAEVIAALRTTCAIDGVVARYAAEDGKRFRA